MKKIILTMLIIMSTAVFGKTPEEIFEQSQQKAQKINYISYNVIDKIKYVESDNFIVDTLYVLAKRNGFVPYINALVRIQYANGNVNSFNGQEIKILDVDEKALFVVDTSEGAYYYVNAAGMPGYIQKHLASRFNKMDFKNYQFKFLNDTVIDKQKCYQVSIFSDINNPASKKEEQVAIVRDSAVLAVSKTDSLIRRYYRKVSLENGKTQVEEQIFTNIQTGLPIDDLMFDVSLPKSFRLVTPKSQKRDDGLLAIGSEAPKWVLGDDKDKEHRLSDYKGKVVVMDFWGTWCKWCRKAMPKLEEIHQEYKDKDVVVLGISCQEPHNADPRKYMDKNGIHYQLLVQGDEVANHYKIKGFPTLYIIGKDGKVAWHFVGYAEDLKEKLQEIINEELAK